MIGSCMRKLILKMDQRLLKAEAERRNKGGFMQIEAELSKHKDSISELLCFFKNLLEYEKCWNLQCGLVIWQFNHPNILHRVRQYVSLKRE